MFKIVALVYVMIAGQPVGEPYPFTHYATFNGYDACVAYFKTDEFANYRTGLSRFVTVAVSREQEAKAKKAEEDVPVFDTAIIAACHDDDRL